MSRDVHCGNQTTNEQGSECTEPVQRRHLGQMGVEGEVTRPPRHARTESCGWAVRVPAPQTDGALYRLRQLGITPCRVVPDEGAGT